MEVLRSPAAQAEKVLQEGIVRAGRPGKKDLVVGLDCSTTAAKAIAFDREGNVVARASAPIRLSSPQPGFYEQDPDDWWGSARMVLRRITGQVDPGRIASLAISNQRETFVPLGRDERPLRPAIVWLDERCKGEVERFSRRIGKERIHRITGKPADYAPVVYRLAWMKRHEPGRFRKIRMVCDVQSFIVRALTGSWATSWASADPLGLFDVERKRWSPVILQELGLSAGELPLVRPPGAVVGGITEASSKATGLRGGTPVIAGGGDGQAAGLGSGVLNPERAYLNLGTAVVAGVYGKRYRTGRAFRTMCACSDAGYYYECSLRAGTFALDWFIRKILRIDPLRRPGIYRTLEREARDIPPGSGGVFHLPYLCGVMNPYWDMEARGVFLGLSSSHGRGHLYRSILEGIAFEQRGAIDSVERTLGTRVREFAVIGGGARSEFWCRVIADVTGRRVRIPRVTEASALGAAVAAAVGAGWFETFQKAAKQMTGFRGTIRPDPSNRRTYERLFAVYRTIYPALSSVGS